MGNKPLSLLLSFLSLHVLIFNFQFFPISVLTIIQMWPPFHFAPVVSTDSMKSFMSSFQRMLEELMNIQV